ncbi:DUF4886 domain-containing protein [Sphingobacterium sp. Ka21]|uniref:DUF4886 domain-containing protein n=2 Tax=Sphingobacterium pedocola TaxID=2082722 RepID=A0ABR9TAV1_9SPHI|nr:DUF4886 domain-containing protein [Sphingobacterium pedocola]
MFGNFINAHGTGGASKKHIVDLVETEPAGKKKKVIHILAIGNSFSADALETHFFGIAQAAGVRVIIGNLAAPGAPLDFHVKNFETSANPYLYTKIVLDGTKTVTRNASFGMALKDEKWDYITFQQVSHYAGKYETFGENLPKLVNYVRDSIKYDGVKFALHQTWAYAETSNHPGFPNYNNDQLTMYKAIVKAVNQAAKLVKIKTIIPAGTAIQNARTSVMGSDLTTDGFHLSPSTGRYIAAAVWFEKLTGQDVIGNPYSPAGIGSEELAIMQRAAHAAVKKPDTITVIQPVSKTSKKLNIAN